MSEYSAKLGHMRGYAKSAVSVGDTIDHNQVYNSKHPMYLEYSEQLRKKIAEIIARESEKQAKAQQAVCTIALPAEAKDEMVREYPEFRIVWPGWRVPVHSVWTARRQLLNQYMMYHLRRYAGSYVHYGGGALAYLTFGIDDVHLRVNGSSPVAVHESFDDDVACSRLLASRATAATALGWITDDAVVGRYVAGDSLRKEIAVGRSVAKADALIVDGGLYPLSPLQFAMAMVQHGAGVGMFSLPYHPSMLVHSGGILPGTDVSYVVDECDISFQYPDGIAGVTNYSAAVWHQWLVNCVRQVDGVQAVSFQYELMGVRGSFMVVRVVRIEGEPHNSGTFVHSLQLDVKDDYTLVKTWKVRSLASNVMDEASWEEVAISVPTRVVEKTHDYAMALSADQFSRHAIRKRLAVVNDRVVVQGTSVEVHESLTSDVLDVLEIAIFTHCFVARYETGKLASALRQVVDDVAGFGNLSFGSRLSHVMAVCMSLAYDWSLGRVDEALRSVLDGIRSWFRGLPKRRKTTFQPVPQFIRYENLVGAKSKGVLAAVVKVMRGSVRIADLVPAMPGFDYLSVIGAVHTGDSVAVPDIGIDLEVSRNGVELFSDVVDTAGDSHGSESAKAFVRQVKALNEMDEDGNFRHHLNMVTHSTGLLAEDIPRDDYQYDPGFKATLDDFHEAVIPGMRAIDFKYDPSSISVDDQDRSLAAEYLDLPKDFGGVPSTMQIYESNLNAYNVTKRPGTLQETLSAFHARNLSAPVLALPQHDTELIHEIVEDFLDIACLPDARARLEAFKTDPVSLEERALLDWTGKARPDNVLKVFKQLVEDPQAMEEFMTGRYESMPKADVKPPLSDKPLHSRVEPQMIVHHKTAINALFSSILRVLVRRFLSLLKPNFMLNLLKDMPEVRDVIQNYHAWGELVTYLENDFGKFDKSQAQFVHWLERHMFTILGMNDKFLQQWGLGHIDCNIRSVTTGLSLWVRYQRKSGDASTSFGNGMLNILSVVHAYKGTDIVWAVFMGDDSLVEARTVCAGEVAVQALAEKFNLQAKFFVTSAPYFASNFVLINESERRVTCVPDPVKRVEKWSMAVPALDPKWDERYLSAVNSLSVYKQRSNLVGLGRALYERYGLHDGLEPQEVADAVASAIRTLADFRSMWKDDSMALVF